MTNAVNLASAAGTGFAFRNRIINGDMRITQRNGTSSVTPSNGAYTLDRWGTWVSQASKLTIQQNAGAITPPSGFTNYLGVTSSSAYSATASDYFGVWQGIEGFNVADLDWGTASAKSITISFWVRSSLTGTFGGMIQNAAGNRGYTFSYSISAANTWEYKTITVAGDTTGTWTKDNTRGLHLYFNLGAGSSNTGAAGAWGSTFYQAPTGAVSVVGTNGATFYLTGVQLEEGSVATPFERRPYGLELALCERYYVGFRSYAFTVGYDSAYSSLNSGGLTWDRAMRATPSIVILSGGMGGHHGVAPTVRDGPFYQGVGLQFTGSGLRTNANCNAEVTLSRSAEL